MGDDELSEIATPSGSVRQFCEQTYVPLHLISYWQEPGTTLPRLTIAIVLPSGAGPGYFKYWVIEEGNVLELTVDWSQPLIDISCMHKKWLVRPGSTFNTFHPKYFGFEAALRKLRQTMSSTVSSVARIGLSITVQTYIEVQDKHNLAWLDNTTRMVYEYSVIKETSEFEEY